MSKIKLLLLVIFLQRVATQLLLVYFDPNFGFFLTSHTKRVPYKTAGNARDLPDFN